MNKIFALLFVFFWFVGSCYGQNVFSPRYSYTQIKEYIKGSASFSELENQLDVDNVVSDKLGVDFIYTDLSECLKYALKDNYDIKMKDYLNRQKLWNYRNSIVKIVPNLHYDYTRQDLKGEFLVGGIVPLRVHEITTNLYLNFEWDWFNKGKYFFDVFQNKYISLGAKADKKFSVDETLLKTSIAYYNLLQTKLEIEAYRANLFELTYYNELAEARYKAGLDRKYDVKRSEADLERAKKDYETSVNALRLKQAELAAFMGAEVMCPVYPFETNASPREMINEKYSVDELYFIAEKMREDIKALKAEIKAEIVKKNSYYTDILPDFTVAYQDGYAGNRRTGLRGNKILVFNASISLGQNLLSGTITQIKAEEEYIKSRQMELKRKEQEIKTAILTSYLAKDNAIKSISASQKEFDAAQESLNLAVAGYKEGQSSFSDVLDAQSLKTQAKLNLVKNSIEYNKAQIQLLFESGIISYSNILNNYSLKQS